MKNTSENEPYLFTLRRIDNQSLPGEAKSIISEFQVSLSVLVHAILAKKRFVFQVSGAIKALLFDGKGSGQWLSLDRPCSNIQPFCMLISLIPSQVSTTYNALPIISTFLAQRVQ
jgi:hypothetical protein